MADSYSQKNIASYNAHANEWASSTTTNVGHKYLEKPAIEKELPKSLKGKSVLCVGVGSGEELASILNRNPDKVVAIDISEKLLQIAEQKYKSIEFHQMDMRHLSFPAESFDLIYSSLVFHYANDWDVLLRGVCRVLKQNGTLLFSTDRPEYWKHKQKTGNTYTNSRGILLEEYTHTIPGDISIIFYNHPSSEVLLDDIKHAGFRVETCFPAQVVEANETEYKNMGETERKGYDALKETNTSSPLFLIIRATKAQPHAH